jgi:hypothetical protein
MASNCENCFLRRRALARPQSLLARLWRWHTGWCPGYKAYQAQLKEKSVNEPEQRNLINPAKKEENTGNSR